MTVESYSGAPSRPYLRDSGGNNPNHILQPYSLYSSSSRHLSSTTMVAKHRMSSLHVIVCLLDQLTHAVAKHGMSQSINSELQFLVYAFEHLRAATSNFSGHFLH